MMNFIKENYKKILIVLFVLIFFSTCSKNCSKSNDIRQYEVELDSCKNLSNTLNDSVLTLNTIIDQKNIEINEKDKQIDQLKSTVSAMINKNSINHIRVVIPDDKKENK